MTRTTSAIGRAVLTAREGVRLVAYKDSVGVPTIGVGHTGRASPPVVTMGMSITKAQADAYLAADLAPMEAAVNAAVKVALADNEFDALVSFCFNVGETGFKGSTVVRLLNESNKPGAGDALLMWDKPPQIMSRRSAERAQFLTPYSQAMPFARVGEAAIKAPVAPTVLPSVVTPAPSPQPKPGLLGWFKSLFTRKAA